MMTLATELREQGHQVSFLTFKGRSLGEHVQRVGFGHHEIPVKLKVDPLAIAKMARHYQRIGADVVHCHLSTSAVNGAIAARLAKIPCVSTVHGMSGRLSFLPSHHMIAVSSEVRRHLITQGVHESKISIVPNGIAFHPWDETQRTAARLELGLDLESPILGTTARLTKLKGVDHALYALSRVRQDMPHVKYVVFGDGEERNALMALAKDLGLKDSVIWAGYRTDVQALLPALDVFLFPSLREAMGISIVEAMGAKVPTIATKIGGIPEVLANDTGVLVPPADAVTLADAILQLLRDPQRRASIAEAAWNRAHDEYSVKRMAARTLGVYAALIARANRA